MSKLLDFLFPLRVRHRNAVALSEKLTMQFILGLNRMTPDQRGELYHCLEISSRALGRDLTAIDVSAAPCDLCVLDARGFEPDQPRGPLRFEFTPEQIEARQRALGTLKEGMGAVEPSELINNPKQNKGLYPYPKSV